MPDPDAQDEVQLIARSRQGDRDAFDRLMGRYGTSIRNFAYRMTNDPEEAEQLHQQVLDRAFDDIRSLQAASSFPLWLYRIVRNTYLDEQKRRRRPSTASSAQP